MKKLTFATVLMLFIAFTVSFAQPMHGLGHKSKMNKRGLPGLHFYERFQSNLKITDKQIAKMKAIDYKFKEEMIDLKARTMHGKLEMKKLFDLTNIDKNAVLNRQKIMQEIGNKISNKALIYKLDIYEILSDEQRTNAKELKRKRSMGHGKGCGQGRGKGGGKGMRGDLMQDNNHLMGFDMEEFQDFDE